MKIECEFGCDCDTPTDFGIFDSILDQPDFDRLVQEKIARARRYIEIQEKIGGEIESD